MTTPHSTNRALHEISSALYSLSVKIDNFTQASQRLSATHVPSFEAQQALMSLSRLAEDLQHSLSQSEKAKNDHVRSECWSKFSTDFSYLRTLIGVYSTEFSAMITRARAAHTSTVRGLIDRAVMALDSPESFHELLRHIEACATRLRHAQSHVVSSTSSPPTVRIEINGIRLDQQA